MAVDNFETYMEKYNKIISIVKDEMLTASILQTEAITGVDYKLIMNSMGFGI